MASNKTRQAVGARQRALDISQRAGKTKMPLADQAMMLAGSPKKGTQDALQYEQAKIQHRIKELKDLDLHIFGHIHCHGGSQVHRDGVSYYNASICDEMYMPTNPVRIVEI